MRCVLSQPFCADFVGLFCFAPQNIRDVRDAEATTGCEALLVGGGKGMDERHVEHVLRWAEGEGGGESEGGVGGGEGERFVAGADESV